MNKKIGLIDADLLGRGTRHPNLSLLKLAGWHKKQGDDVELVKTWEDFESAAGAYDHLYLARVFDFTKVPEGILDRKNLTYGGTGFRQGFVTYAPNPEAPEAIERSGFLRALPDAVEHTMPDYHLYDSFVADEIARGIHAGKYKDYADFSIGFMTRGCFRHCSFCVNQCSNGAVFHAHLKEFLDPARKMIYLWDDNILSYPKWREVFEELAETGKRFQFKQGMDIRLMTDEKAEILSNSKYYSDYTFAFDHLEERRFIEHGLDIWRNHSSRIPRLYVLVGWDSQDANDIEAAFLRIKILMQHRALPYIMRHEYYQRSKYKGMYTTMARWCNQPSFFKKKSFIEYCEANGETSSAMRYASEFAHDHPEIAKKYYTMRFDQLSS